MQQNFDKIMDFVFLWEGWRSDDPDDAGGKTVWGICERDYPVDVPLMWNMPKLESQAHAKVIFRRDYWDKVGGDNLPKGTDAIVMDAAVNMGKTFAKTLKGYDTAMAFAKRIERYAEIAHLGNNIKFLRGWIRRSVDLFYFVKKNFE